MLRTCDKCGKANQPTRKYCIRCGSSLLKPVKKKAAAPILEVAQPTPVVETPAPPIAEPQPSVIAEASVRPSEVSTDRIRSGSGFEKPKSELEKAKEAFAKAETVGIDEAAGSGIIETRMLRASEVKELLEGPGTIGGEDIPAPKMMEGSEPLPPEAAHMMPPTGPTAAQIEESILGSKSAYVEQPPEPEPEPVAEAPVIEAITAEEPSQPISDTGSAPATPTPAATSEPTPAEPATKPSDSEIDLVSTCPDCGKVINLDMFEYPKDVYSKMGVARLNQARIYIVQGKPDEAMKIVRMARALYEKADDTKGLKEVLKLVESLAKSA